MQLPFTNPFRYSPHPLVKRAAADVMDTLANNIKEDEGKMLGVLICQPGENSNVEQILNLHKLECGSSETPLYYIAAFSGNVHNAQGRVTATVEGFVPPIIDLTDPEGYFKRKEAEISLLNKQIARIASNTDLQELEKELSQATAERDAEIKDMQTQISLSKSRRDKIRTETADTDTLEGLIKESQFQKAELKRIKDRWKCTITEIEGKILEAKNEITRLKALRSSMSDSLQKWIFENAVVHNAKGESTSIWELFQNQGLTPPGGTGDCAAPKLLEHAYRHGLQPIAMGEFWWGKSPETAVRTHGHFYPSCTSKCGPLLGYMMQGLDVQQEEKAVSESPIVIHEDESIIVVEKPSGMPSVPGLDGRLSLLEWLNERKGLSAEVVAVHRLDMDTSGVMVFAKTREAEINLKRQFEVHSVRKTYIARITCAVCTDSETTPPTSWAPPPAARGVARFLHLYRQHTNSVRIDLPLSADYDERPRQKVDFKQGKAAYTEYQIISQNSDGTVDLLLYPHTGRTHQLRVHCAHTLGLGSPIAGDLLYGAHTTKNDAYGAERLCLHALSITFNHPLSGEEITFTSRELCW